MIKIYNVEDFTRPFETVISPKIRKSLDSQWSLGAFELFKQKLTESKQIERANNFGGIEQSLKEAENCILYPFLTPIARELLPNFGGIEPYLAKFRIKQIENIWYLNFNYFHPNETQNNKGLLDLESLATNPDFLRKIRELNPSIIDLEIKAKNSNCCKSLCASCTKVELPFYYVANQELRVRMNQDQL